MKLSVKELEAKRLWRIKNPDYMKQYAAKNKVALELKALYRHYRQKFGIEYTQFCDMVVAQNGRCKLCGYQPSVRLAVDHDHKTGQIRGLLCNTCNRVIVARLEKDEKFLERLTSYMGGK